MFWYCVPVNTHTPAVLWWPLYQTDQCAFQLLAAPPDPVPYSVSVAVSTAGRIYVDLLVDQWESLVFWLENLFS